MHLRAASLAYAAGLFSQLAQAQPSPSSSPSTACINSTEIHLRGPPSQNSSFVNATWTPPPPGWIFGSWSIGYASVPSTGIYNQHYDLYPRFPENTSQPLVQITEIISIDTANRSIPSVTLYCNDYQIEDYSQPLSINLTVSSSGSFLFGIVYDIIAWGYDTNGDGFYVGSQLAGYGARQDPPQMSFVSRRIGGPSNETVELLKRSIIALGDDTVTQQVNNLTATNFDDRLRELQPIVCDATCMNNTIAASQLSGGV